MVLDGEGEARRWKAEEGREGEKEGREGGSINQVTDNFSYAAGEFSS